MPNTKKHTYSRYSSNAVMLLATLIRATRKEQKLTVQEIADRAGISRGLLQRIEKGDMKCGIGTVFEVATILGIPLFSTDESAIKQHLQYTTEKLALLPKSIRKKNRVVADDF